MLLAVLLSGAATAPVRADDNAKQALLVCANESDDTRRLRCFDAAVATLRSAPTEPMPASPAVTAEDRFGARGDLKPDKLPELKEITAIVTAVRAKPYGELVITLDNDQVWTEIATGSKIRIKAGDSVKIETGALGSYSVIAPNGRSSKVSRVR